MKNLILSTTIIFCIAFFACKKYPEGGFLKQGPKTLITDKNGNWQLYLYEVNGIDSTNIIPGGNYPLEDFYKYFFGFSSYKDGHTKKYHSNILLFPYTNTFIENNKKIIFLCGNYNSTRCDSINGVKYFSRNIFGPETDGTVWNIIKHRDKECILTYSSKNNYKIILKR